MRSTSRCRLPPQKSALFHFLSSICRTSFPFLPFSAAASLVSNPYSCILNTFSETGRADLMMTWLSQWRHLIRKVFWCNAQSWELERWFMNLFPITVQLFGFFHWTVSISFFCCQYTGHILKIYRVSNDATIEASVCILNSVCSLHFVLTVVCILNPICNLQSVVCILYWPVSEFHVKFGSQEGEIKLLDFFSKIDPIRKTNSRTF